MRYAARISCHVLLSQHKLAVESAVFSCVRGCSSVVHSTVTVLGAVKTFQFEAPVRVIDCHSAQCQRRVGHRMGTTGNSKWKLPTFFKVYERTVGTYDPHIAVIAASEGVQALRL